MNLFSHPSGIEFPAAGAAGCNLRNPCLELRIAIPTLECVAFLPQKTPLQCTSASGFYGCFGVMSYYNYNNVSDLIYLLTGSDNTIT